MVTSPFSLQHDWSVNWKRIPSNFRIDPRVNINSMKERKAIQAIASVGIIGEKQLSRLFSLNEKEIKNMEQTHKIVRHELKRNKSEVIPIYTLGVKGAMALKLDAYEENYWVEYFSDDILKRLLFFQVYHFFPTLKVVPTPEPFSAAVQNNDNLIYVYVIKGDTNDIARYLKWQKKKEHRLIIVTESLDKLKPLDLFLDELKLRIVIESDLLTHQTSNQDIFYYYKNGELVR